jgi:5-formyltetrahydrofolate cyclo-ligase
MAFSSTSDAKRVLRLEMRAARKACAGKTPDAARRAAAGLRLEEAQAVRIVGGYVAHGSELDPSPLMARFAGAGAELALPVATGPDRPLAFRRWRVGEPLQPDALGMAAPGPEAEAVEPDYLIVPLLAFDRRGFRLGQGGGHYDRTLEALEAKGPVFKLGLAYAGQEVARIPAEEHDRRLDAILTEIGYIAVREDL